MIPAAFEYVRAGSVDEAIECLARGGPDTKVLAGGHSLVPMIKLRLARPSRLIDIGRLAELRYVRDEGDVVAIGALATHAEVASSAVVRRQAPLLAEAAAAIGDVQVRNRGTVGGSLAHADPAADYPAAVLAARAELVARGPGGRRRAIPAGSYFLGLFTTALEPDELLVEVRVPARPAGAGAAYVKYPHPASGFAVVGCAAQVTARGGAFADVAVAFTGLAAAPFRDAEVESALRGQPATEAAVAAAAERAARGVEHVLSDTFTASEPDYRRHLARVYARRALARALAQVG